MFSVKRFMQGLLRIGSQGFSRPFSFYPASHQKIKKNGKVEKNGVSAEGILLAVLLCSGDILGVGGCSYFRTASEAKKGQSFASAPGYEHLRRVKHFWPRRSLTRR
jgi:hypothetical protein